VSRTSVIYAEDGLKISVGGRDFVAFNTGTEECAGCVAFCSSALCNAIHDEVDMCGLSIWVTEIDYLKRKVRDD